MTADSIASLALQGLSLIVAIVPVLYAFHRAVGSRIDKAAATISEMSAQLAVQSERILSLSSKVAALERKLEDERSRIEQLARSVDILKLNVDMLRALYSRNPQEGAASKHSD